MNKTIHTEKSKTEISSNALWNWFMSTFMFTILFKAFNDFLVYSLGHLFEFFIYFWCWQFQSERSLCSADGGTTSSSTSYHTSLLDLSFTQEGDQCTFNSRWTLCASWTCEWLCLGHMATYCLCSLTCCMSSLRCVELYCSPEQVERQGGSPLMSVRCSGVCLLFAFERKAGKQEREDDWLFGRLSENPSCPERRRHKDFCCSRWQLMQIYFFLGVLLTCKQLWEILCLAAAEPLVEVVPTLTGIKHKYLSYISLCKWDACICFLHGTVWF